MSGMSTPSSANAMAKCFARSCMVPLLRALFGPLYASMRQVCRSTVRNTLASWRITGRTSGRRAPEVDPNARGVSARISQSFSCGSLSPISCCSSGTACASVWPSWRTSSANMPIRLPSGAVCSSTHASGPAFCSMSTSRNVRTMSSARFQARVLLCLGTTSVAPLPASRTKLASAFNTRQPCWDSSAPCRGKSSPKRWVMRSTRRCGGSRGPRRTLNRQHAVSASSLPRATGATSLSTPAARRASAATAARALESTATSDFFLHISGPLTCPSAITCSSGYSSMTSATLRTTLRPSSVKFEV
mmetsp:Transcript_27592/g.83189  ORF Transcript_27592/g.83189 Transcript_27592/m.83189 type:complete len:303 (-) Transcript_27592:64-972(-)